MKVRVLLIVFCLFNVTQGITWDEMITHFFPSTNTIQQENSYVPLNDLSQQDINVYLRHGLRLMKVITDNQVAHEFPSHALKNFFGGGLSPEVEILNERSKATLLAAKILQNKYVNAGEATKNSFVNFLISQGYRGLSGKNMKAACTATGAQSLDGTCNNLERPIWGSANTPYTRLAKHKYADGLYSLPLAKSGRPLPSPRLISSKLFVDKPDVNQIHTMLSAHWGQLIAHDLSMQALDQTKKSGIQCCLQNGSALLPESERHPACAPVEVPADDPFYTYHNVKYLNFVRSVTTPNLDGSIGPAEQLNTVSSYIDASPIYSNDQPIFGNIRTFRKGTLRLNKNGLLPSATNSHELCDTSLTPGRCPCYFAGDPRVNQTPILAALHTLLARQHNQIAIALSQINPHWNDDRIFIETRRIVIAIIQHITYQEWIPLTIGKSYARKNNISPRSLFSFDYNSNVNPGISNGFASGAFRYFHTLIPGEFRLSKKDGTDQFFKLRDYFMRPGILEEENDGFDSVLRGALLQPAMEADDCFSSELTNFFFKSTNSWGMDLMTADIHRGRDHGIAGYNEYRTICGYPRAYSFEDLQDSIPKEKIERLKSIYEHVDDIDLLVGGIFESDAGESILGPTFQCIIGEQFYRTRLGDRYFYDYGDMPHSFTSSQLKEIKKMTMARLICDNGDGLQRIQRKAFEMISPTNTVCNCKDLPRINLMHWKE